MFSRLIAHFSETTELPIEIQDIRAKIVELGIQDEIKFFEHDIDPGKLRGVYYQYTRRDGVYGDPVLCSLIVYSSRLSVDWQRVVCCKEMIHILDGQAERTKTPEEVHGLVDKLLGPLSTEDFGIADFMAAKDRLALYQALMLLFPAAARREAVERLASGEVDIESIAKWACLPTVLTKVVMSDDWPELSRELIQD
jgi:hypothetical protein